MRKDEFCVNDKERGSCWGNVLTADELNEFLNKEERIRYIQTLHEWNGKIYLFFRDEMLNNNYFVEVKK